MFIYRSHLAEALGRIRTAHHLLIEAQGHVLERHRAATRSWAAAREAEITATLGDQAAALNALKRAAAAYDQARPHGERSWTGSLNPGLLASATVTTYARLGHPELDAITDSALGALSQIDLRRKTMALADAATAAIRRDRFDQAAQFGHEALDLAATRTNRLIAERLDTLHGAVKDKSEIPTLTKLHDRLVSRTP